MADYMKAGDQVGANVGAPKGMDQFVMCPRMDFAMAVGEPDGQGGFRQIAHQTGHNVVVTQARQYVLNRLFQAASAATASTAGAALFLHSYTTSVTAGHESIGWGSVSGSNVNVGTATSFHAFSLAASTAGSTMSWSTSYSVTANATVYGAGVLFGTSSAIRTQATSNEVQLYNIGNFAASQGLANGNVLSVTVNFTFA